MKSSLGRYIDKLGINIIIKRNSDHEIINKVEIKIFALFCDATDFVKEALTVNISEEN